MKKVLMLLKSNQYAGAEQVAITIMQNLQDEYECCYVSPYGEIARQLETYKLNYIPLKNFQIGEIRKVLRLVKPDIIHAHDFSASVAASLLKSIDGKQRLISHIHCNAKENLVWGKKAILYLAALRRIDCVISVSQAVAEEAVFRKALKSKVKIMGNPADKARIRQMAEIGRSDFYDVIFVGRLSRQKNPQKFIHIVHQLKISGQKIRAAIVGEGELFEECNRLIWEYDLNNEVRMLGFLDNPYVVMKNSKVLCMTSEEEGFGLAVAEAMVLGIPVLVSGIGGMKELLGEHAEEFCKTEEEYVWKIKRLLYQNDFYQKEQNRMKEKADCFPNLQEYISKIRTMYEEL